MMWDKKLAKLMRERENPSVIGPVIGKVIKPMPNIEIKFLSGKGLLDKDDLYINANLVAGYRRIIESNGTIDLGDELCGQTDLIHDGGDQATSHQHTLETLEVTDGPYSLEGEIILKDSLNIGDEVLLLPTNNNQKFFIICKVKKLGD